MSDDIKPTSDDPISNKQYMEELWAKDDTTEVLSVKLGLCGLTFSTASIANRFTGDYAVPSSDVEVREDGYHPKIVASLKTKHREDGNVLSLGEVTISNKLMWLDDERYDVYRKGTPFNEEVLHALMCECSKHPKELMVFTGLYSTDLFDEMFDDDASISYSNDAIIITALCEQENSRNLPVGVICEVKVFTEDAEEIVIEAMRTAKKCAFAMKRFDRSYLLNSSLAPILNKAINDLFYRLISRDHNYGWADGELWWDSDRDAGIVAKLGFTKYRNEPNHDPMNFSLAIYDVGSEPELSDEWINIDGNKTVHLSVTMLERLLRSNKIEHGIVTTSLYKDDTWLRRYHIKDNAGEIILDIKISEVVEDNNVVELKR